jgi:hypothetical protein
VRLPRYGAQIDYRLPCVPPPPVPSAMALARCPMPLAPMPLAPMPLAAMAATVFPSLNPESAHRR